MVSIEEFNAIVSFSLVQFTWVRLYKALSLYSQYRNKMFAFIEHTVATLCSASVSECTTSFLIVKVWFPEHTSAPAGF